MWVTSSPATALTPTAVALGNFDGIHRGHQKVIQPILQSAKTSEPREGVREFDALLLPNQEENADPSSLRGEPRHIYATMATFYPHPREFFSGQAWKLLTPRQEKVRQLSTLGLEQLVLLPFDRELASLCPKDFVQKILVDYLQVTHVSVGADFHFGHRRTGTAQDLQAIASAYGIEVTIVPLQTCEGERISSSLIRQSLQQGDIPRANRLLGRSYNLSGVVVQGQQLGRTIGFPTANLQIPPDKFLPQNGVYCVQVQTSALESFWGVMNIGERPTVNGTSLTVEIHLLEWSGDLYGQTLTVSLEEFIRTEQKFASLDALKSQIQADCEVARAFFGHSRE